VFLAEETVSAEYRCVLDHPLIQRARLPLKATWASVSATEVPPAEYRSRASAVGDRLKHELLANRVPNPRRHLGEVEGFRPGDRQDLPSSGLKFAIPRGLR